MFLKYIYIIGRKRQEPHTASISRNRKKLTFHSSALVIQSLLYPDVDTPLSKQLQAGARSLSVMIVRKLRKTLLVDLGKVITPFLTTSCSIFPFTLPLLSRPLLHSHLSVAPALLLPLLSIYLLCSGQSALLPPQLLNSVPHLHNANLHHLTLNWNF